MDAQTEKTIKSIASLVVSEVDVWIDCAAADDDGRLNYVDTALDAFIDRYLTGEEKAVALANRDELAMTIVSKM